MPHFCVQDLVQRVAQDLLYATVLSVILFPVRILKPNTRLQRYVSAL